MQFKIPKPGYRFKLYTHQISSIFNLLTGLIEACLFLGFSTSFFFLTDQLVKLDYFCESYPSFQNISQNCEITTQYNNSSSIVVFSLIIFNIFGYSYGEFIDSFKVVYVRITIMVLHFFGLFFVSTLDISNQYFNLYVGQFFMSLGNGILFVETMRDTPQAVPFLENYVRSMINGFPIVSGSFYHWIAKNLNQEVNILGICKVTLTFKNFSYLMMLTVLLLSGLRTAIWLRGQFDYERTNHISFFNKAKGSKDNIYSENRSNLHQYHGYKTTTIGDGIKRLTIRNIDQLAEEAEMQFKSKRDEDRSRQNLSVSSEDSQIITHRSL